MKISLRMFGQFRHQFGGERELEVSPGMTPREVLEVLVEGSADGRFALFDEEGQIRSHIMLMVNRERIAREAHGTVILHEADELAVLPPVAGG
ncbi:MAG: MoaD/ThiS family protein [Methanomicrobiaceae archaeon]|nr:MoaD/ThiS family protein [Methanomicrobiaceae archaeon]